MIVVKINQITARSILKARKLKKKLRGMGIALRGGGIVSRS